MTMGPARILLIEENLETIDTIRSVTRDKIQSLLTVVDGFSSLGALHDVDPDLIILSLNLPEGAGLKIWDRLKSGHNLSQYPVMLVAWDMSQLTPAQHQLADDLLITPVSETEAEFRIRRTLDKLSLVRQLDHWQVKFERAIDEKTLALTVDNQRLNDEVQERRYMQERLQFLADHDPVTRLYNRAALENEVTTVIARVQLQRTRAAFVSIEIEQLGLINGSCGCAAGDELLRQLGRVFADIVTNRTYLARVGGAKFGLLCLETTLEGAQKSAQYVQQMINDFVFSHDDKTFSLTATLAVVEMDEGIHSFDQLLLVADELIFQARSEGDNNIKVYTEPSPDVAEARRNIIDWESRLITALRKNQFRIWFQRIQRLTVNHYKKDVVYDDANSRDVKIEVLVRLYDKESDTLIHPRQFLPVATRLNLVSRIDRWMVTEVMKFLADNPSLIDVLHRVSINLAAVSMRDIGFAEYIVELVKINRLPPGLLCFEITESEAIDLDSARAFMNVLSELGCNLALDDFGSGFSSFRYLQELPFNIVKIEGDFIKQLDRNPSYLALVKSITEVAHQLNKEVIAEFVESEAIERELAKLGIEWGQGYFCHRPEALTHEALHRSQR